MVIQQLISPIASIIDKIVPDKDLKMKLQHEIQGELHKANMAQIEVNAKQAEHPSRFVAGARPAIMWVCCLGLMWAFFLAPIANWFLVVFNVDAPLPEIETEGLLTLTLALLGLGGMRSFEKTKGVHRDHMKKGKYN